MYFKETTMAEQCIWLKKRNNGWTIYFKENMAEQCILRNEVTMAEQCILKKQQWLNNVF